MPTKVADRLNQAAGCWLRLVTYCSRVVAATYPDPFTALAMVVALDSMLVVALAALGKIAIIFEKAHTGKIVYNCTAKND